MTDGMKSGAGSDPFADESSDNETSESSDMASHQRDPPSTDSSELEEEDPTIQPTSDGAESSTALSGDDLPYIFARSGVKDDRTMVQYFLREDTKALEAEAQHAVEQELGTDVYLTDVREALVRIGAQHIDEIADELRDWGYRYKEDTN